ncbi:MAG: DNA (cytosine-5-)-methyltransferase [Dehalococcoidia bacterium]
MRTVSIFSGCGGSDLGAHRAGAEIVYALDKYSLAIETYRRHKDQLAAPDAKIVHGDIATVDKLPACELLIGCYPCQSFTMGGKRSPSDHPDSELFLQFQRALEISDAKYFVAENVSGLAWLKGGSFLQSHLAAFAGVGKGYKVTYALVNARDFGVPADRKRVFIVGVRKDVGEYYWFPPPTHGRPGSELEQWASHGDAIASLPLDAPGEYYHYEKEPFSWWFMSRNRKRRWEEPGYAITANWRHVTLHPASPTMRLVESNLVDGSKQKWEFTQEHDHLFDKKDRPVLEQPRRLTWRECAILQTFPSDFEPAGPVEAKYRQIGNAVPPALMEKIVSGLIDGTALHDDLPPAQHGYVV